MATHSRCWASGLRRIASAAIALSLLSSASAVASAGADDKEVQCAGVELTPTLVGTNGPDHLIGTPGRDVIVGGPGDDTVDGRGGNDVIVGGPGDDTIDGGRGDDRLCGEQGDDLVVAGAGDDIVEGGNGEDIVSAGLGADVLEGGNGGDVLAGGRGDDVVLGENGRDGVGGGEGDDSPAGGPGDDRVAGEDGADAADGGAGADACEAEEATACESPLPPAAATMSLNVTALQADPGSYRVDWAASAPTGVRLVELLADDLLVRHERGDGGAQVQGSFEVSPAELPGSIVDLTAVATDAEGRQVGSEPVTLDVPQDWTPLPPEAAIELLSPTPMATLVALLADAGLSPLEYRADDVDAEPLSPAPDLAAQLALEGADVYVPSEVHVIYSPLGTALEEQAGELGTYFIDHAIDGEPLISTVLVEGPISADDLGPLASVAVLKGNAPAPTVGSLDDEGDDDEDGEEDAAGTVATAVSTAEDVSGAYWPAAGRFWVEARPAKHPRVLLTELCGQDVIRHAWTSRDDELDVLIEGGWATPGYHAQVPRSELSGARALFRGPSVFGSPLSEGQAAWVDEHSDETWPPSVPICRTVVWEFEYAVAALQHDLVWDRETLEEFRARKDAYEHNVKVKSPGRRSIRFIGRPGCNPWTADNFYVRAERSKFTMHNVPREAELYNDTVTAFDSCDENEVSFGIVHPERIDDEAPGIEGPPGIAPYVIVIQESDRNDDADRSFHLFAQTLSRSNVGCDRFPRGLKKYCIGIEGSSGTSLASTDDGPLAGTELPTCLVWSWPRTGLGAEELPNFVRGCPNGGPSD